MQFEMRFSLCLVLLATWAISISASFAQDSSMTLEPGVWHWFTTSAHSETLEVRISLEGNTVYHCSIPIHRVTRSENESERPAKTIKFFLKADPRIFASEFRVYPNQKIEGNIWEAGCDSDDIILGVSFVIPKRILLNSVHIALPHRSARSQLAKGLVIETYPLKTVTPPVH